MDIIGLAIDLAQGIRCIVAALKGKRAIVGNFRWFVNWDYTNVMKGRPLLYLNVVS